MFLINLYFDTFFAPPGQINNGWFGNQQIFHFIVDSYTCFKDLTITERLEVPSLLDVLDLVNLQQPYKLFLDLFKEAEDYCITGDLSNFYNTLYKIWVNPNIVPALLLRECYKKKQLIFPTWYNKTIVYTNFLQKKTGGVRPIIICNKQTRLQMSVVNNLLQASCKSWSNKTFGFKPGLGTVDCVNKLALDLNFVLAQGTDNPVILLFDLNKAYNSVNIGHMGRTLQLSNLPKNMRALIWNWQHPINNKAVPLNGLAQGFNYSPTLFAWFLDKQIVQRSNFVVYADNFAGVFKSKQEALYALNQAQLLMHNTGLSIQPQSIQLLTKDQSNVLSWLGHGINLSNGQLLLHKYEQRKQTQKLGLITIQEWDNLLLSSKWLNKVKTNDWRTFK